MSVNPSATRDSQGADVRPGDYVRILSLVLPQDMDDDERDMLEFMVGSICEVDTVDPEGQAWVTMWWNCAEGVATTTVALAPTQMERVGAMVASNVSD